MSNVAVYLNDKQVEELKGLVKWQLSKFVEPNYCNARKLPVHFSPSNPEECLEAIAGITKEMGEMRETEKEFYKRKKAWQGILEQLP